MPNDRKVGPKYCIIFINSNDMPMFNESVTKNATISVSFIVTVNLIFL